MFQYGDLHFGHTLGMFSVRGCHSCLHRWHVSVGSLGMSLVSIIFNFSIIFVASLMEYSYGYISFILNLFYVTTGHGHDARAV